MNTAGEVYRVSVSNKAGDRKKNVKEIVLRENHGIVGDAHAGSERQISLLPFEAFAEIKRIIAWIKPGDFAENITTRGIDLSDISVGDRLKIGGDISLVVTQIGKECHNGCEIRKQVGDCIMPRLGIFARVEYGGVAKPGDKIRKIWK